MRILVVVLAAILAACDSPTRPTPPPPTPPAPTSTVRTIPTNQQRPVRPVDPRFDLQFWRDLVYAEVDRERNGYTGPMPSGSDVLDHVRYFYIETKAMPPDLSGHIERIIPRLWSDLTGWGFTGRIESGLSARPRPGWTSVRVVPPGDGCGGFVDILHMGRNDHTWIELHSDCNDLPGTFAHEFGHALGFKHVRNRGAVMSKTHGSSAFTSAERYHAQLAYEVGHGATYCGWPYSAEC